MDALFFCPLLSTDPGIYILMYILIATQSGMVGEFVAKNKSHPDTLQSPDSKELSRPSLTRALSANAVQEWYPLCDLSAWWDSTTGSSLFSAR